MTALFRFALLGMLLTCFLGIATNSFASQEHNIHDFIFFVDHSGSMSKEIAGSSKIKTAKTILKALNTAIPEQKSKAALYTFAPFACYLEPSEYSKATMGTAIDSINSDIPLFGRTTPMDKGLLGLDSILPRFQGKTEIIMITDGILNKRSNPLPLVRLLYEKYNICLHIISLATTKSGKQVITALDSLKPCSVTARQPQHLYLQGVWRKQYHQCHASKYIF